MVPATAAAQPPEVPVGPGVTLRDGVVIDPSGSLVYVMTPEGGIEAVDVETGEIGWSTDAAVRPLFARGALLVAQTSEEADVLGVVVLHTRQDGRLERRVDVPLPAPARARVDDELGRSFRTRVVAGEGETVTAWVYREELVQGVPPTDGGEALAATVQGAFVLRPTTGETVPLAPEALSALPPPTALVELLGDDRLDGVDGRQFLSADGRHVLASERVDDPRAYHRYRWSIHDRASGRFLGATTHPASVLPFAVARSTLLVETRPALRRLDDEWVEEPLMLHAIDLASGLELWSRPIRDTVYRGPLPP